MHITLETDYAIRIVVFLIQANKRVDAKNISEGTGVTLRFALKILRKLVAAGFIRSFKGIKGGYEFAMESPKSLCLYDVVRAIEGECLLSRCLDANIGCNHKHEESEKECKTCQAFRRATETLQSQLKAVTFDQLI